MEAFKKLIEFVDKIAKYLAVAAFSVMSVMIVLQVIFRYVIGESLSFSEELARYLFVWSSMLGSALCIKRHSHIGFDLIMMYVPKNIKKYGTLIVNLIGMVFFVILVVYGFKVVGITMGQTSPALGVKMGWIYLSIPVSGIIMLLYAIYNTIEDLTYVPKTALEREVEEL